MRTDRNTTEADLLSLEALRGLYKLAGRMRAKVEASSLLRLFDPSASAALDRLIQVESDLAGLIADRQRSDAAKGRAA